MLTSLALLVVSNAAAAQPTARVRLDYIASGSCPDREAFSSQVTARAHHVRIVDDDGPAGTMTVRVHARGARFAGRVIIGTPDGTKSERSVEGNSCNEVVTALALIGALVLEPADVASAGDISNSGNATPVAANADASHAADGSEVAGAKSPEKNATRANAPPVEPDAASAEKTAVSKRNEDELAASDRLERRSDDAASWEISAGANAEIAIGITPRPLGTVPVFIELSRRSPQQILSPAARLRFERPGTDANLTTQGGAHFTWTEAGLDVCPIALWPMRHWRAQPCLRGEAGIVEGTGSGTTPALDQTRPWAMLGVVAESRWELVGPAFLELEAAMLVPLVRDRFYLDPTNSTVFQSSPVGLSAAVGAGLSIW